MWTELQRQYYIIIYHYMHAVYTRVLNIRFSYMFFWCSIVCPCVRAKLLCNMSVGVVYHSSQHRHYGWSRITDRQYIKLQLYLYNCRSRFNHGGGGRKIVFIPLCCLIRLICVICRVHILSTVYYIFSEYDFRDCYIFMFSKLILHVIIFH